MKQLIILITIGVLFLATKKSYSQGVDDVLKLRAFKLYLVQQGQSWPAEYKDLIDCDILIVVSVKNSMLNKINIYSKEEQDYDIVYKNSQQLSGDRQLYNYTAIDNHGVKVSVQIGVTISLPKIWDFTISYPTYDIYYLSK